MNIRPPPSPNPITLDEHQALGRSLFDASEAIVRALPRLVAVYGRDGSEAAAARLAHRALLDLRSQLDDQVCREHPTAPSSVVFGAYFPGASEPGPMRAMGPQTGPPTARNSIRGVSENFRYERPNN
jgi:hypothetical protein